MYKRIAVLLAFLLVPFVLCGQIVIIGPPGGIPGPSPSGPVQPVIQAVIIDALGRPVGSTSGFITVPAFVLVSVNSRVVSLQVFKSGITGSTSGPFFVTNDCSGTAYIAPDQPDAFIQPAVIGPPGKTLYVPKAGAGMQPLTVVSQMITPPAGTPFCVLIPPPPPGPPIPPPPPPVIAADKTVDLNQSFLPPFSIRTQ